MASVALWAIRIGRRLPLPGAAKAHLDRCLAVELFDSVFDENIARPGLLEVLGLVPFTRLSPHFFNVGGEGVHIPMLPDCVWPDSLEPEVFDRADVAEARTKTV